MKALLVLLLLAGPAMADRVTGGTEALNGFRAKVGLPPLTHSGVLQQAAERHARDMARGGFMSHTGSDGSRVGDRATAAGYSWCLIAENIARGQKSLDEVMLGWGTSDGHRANMLAEATEFGLARESGDVWVLVLGRSGC